VAPNHDIDAGEGIRMGTRRAVDHAASRRTTERNLTRRQLPLHTASQVVTPLERDPRRGGTGRPLVLPRHVVDMAEMNRDVPKSTEETDHDKRGDGAPRRPMTPGCP
jgi:hypothetical protein